MGGIAQRAPSGKQVVDYDRRNLALYAALLDADDAGRSWQEAASSLMQLEVACADAEACWRSHIERARWIIGDGMEAAVGAFSARPAPDRR